MMILVFWVRFLIFFSLIFFAQLDLYRLQNTLTKFHEPTCSGCVVRWKVDGNVVIEFWGAFFKGFLNSFFFFFNLIYIGWAYT